MAGLSSGSIPGYYRELFEMLSAGGNKVSRGLWQYVFATSRVSENALEEIWKLSDPAKTGSVGRDGLYKSLALTALAQQGKSIDESALKNFGDKSLPIPTLSTMVEIKDICAKFNRATNPNELGYTYEQLKSLDDIHVSLIPEKKGTLLKHNEYLVESRNFGSTASRRYKDFEGFHQVLLARYPYRLIPSLPPKSIHSTPEFIEQRKRALKRYLTLICRHPVLIKDDTVRYFFTASGADVGSRLKEKYKNGNDEFIFHPYSQNAKDLVNEQTRMKYERVCDQISCMTKIMTSLLRVADNMEYRSRQLCEDARAFNRGLDSISTEPMLSTPWTSASDDSWPKIQLDCRRLADEFTALGDRAKRQSEKQIKGFVESVHLFLDLLSAYQDLANRREKLVHRKHQKALGKAQTMSKWKDHLETHGRGVGHLMQGHLMQSERQEHKFQKTDDDLLMIEARNFFSLFCLDLEAQLIHVNLSQLPEMLHQLVHVQIDGHQEFLQVWEGMKPLVDGMSQSATTTPTSSLGGRSYPGTKSPPGTVDTSPFH